MNKEILRGMLHSAFDGGNVPHNPLLAEMLSALEAEPKWKRTGGGNQPLYATAEISVPVGATQKELAEAADAVRTQLANEVIDTMRGAQVDQYVDAMSFQRRIRVAVPLSEALPGKVDVGVVRSMVDSAYLLGHAAGRAKAEEFAARVAYSAEQLSSRDAAQ